jgi:tetratricopeptide (TPR) repeat protein
MTGDPDAIDPKLEAALDNDLAAALLAWQRETRTHAVFQRPLDGGYTRARVFSVVVDEVGGSVRKCVLKAVPAGERGGTEGNTHAAALASGPSGFAAAHLVEQPYPQRVTEAGGVIMFQAVAGGDMSMFRPLATLWQNGDLPAVARRIARSLLEDWDPDPSVEAMTAQDCVLAQLGRRAQPGGALRRWATTIGDGAASRWVRFVRGGPVLPNPLVWLADEADQTMLVHVGRAHGDLHLDNILIPLVPKVDADRYQLIDLSDFSERAPLCRDVPHLLMATIGKHLVEIPTGRRRALAARIVDAASGVPLGPGTLADQGYERLAEELLGAGDAWADRQDMLDDWRTEQVLGVVAAALIQACISVHQPQVRWWFFEVAAVGLAKCLGDVPALGQEEPVLIGPAGGIGANVATIAERLDNVLAGFGKRKATVLLVGENGLENPAAISRQPWDLIVEFDPATNATGGYSRRPRDRDHRLVSFEQEPSFSAQATVWLAAAGIDGGRSCPDDLRAWRRDCMPGIKAAVETFATFSARSVVICTAGTLGGKARATLDALLDACTARAELVAIAADGAAELADYMPEVLSADPSAVFLALPDRTAPDQTSHAFTIPARRGEEFVPVRLADADLAWISKSGHVLHSELGRTSDREAAVGEGFYRGETISWLELDLKADVPREITRALLETVDRDLFNRDIRRISLLHYPGAGGTTVARRVAWDLHDRYPVLMVEQAHDALALVDRLRRIQAVTDNATLVVFESTLRAVIDLAYSEIRANSLACVFVIVERRADEPADAGERSFYLGPLRTSERDAFVKTFGEQFPERHPSLTRLANSLDRAIVPFLFGLTTYEKDYTGLANYVERSLALVSERERDGLKLIALVHHYTGLTLPSALLAGVLDVPDGEDVELRRWIGSELMTMLIEGQPEFWRTMHDLIARESLTQLLTPRGAGAPGGPEDWKVALSTLAGELIRQAAREYGGLIPAEVRSILDQLFIVRDNKAVFSGERQLFSELLTDVPSAEGRIEVMRTLAESFPEEPHFWAHLARLLGLAKDHPAALEAIDRALNIERDDDVLYHMKGMILRYKLRSVTENRERLDTRQLRERVFEDVREAREQFERSIELNDESEYGHVALVQLCIQAIEFGRSQSEAATYSTFLAAPSSAYYRELLALAEENLQQVREVSGGDRPSRFAAVAEADVRAFYDDYGALLQGWRNLLDRHDLIKAPIRRQLVRVYERRAGSWRAAHADDRARAMELLEENLRDDPSDTRSLAEWLRLGRYRNVSLDRAAELIQYSAHHPMTTPRNIIFYDYVVAALLALTGRDTAAIEYARKVERSRERAANFPNRRFVYEWYASGSGLAHLAHYTDLDGWDRNADSADPASLVRLEGRVQRIRRPQSGQIDFGPGLRAFFPPGRSGMVADRHTNARVSFLLGFSYDGPQAWSVRLLDA